MHDVSCRTSSRRNDAPSSSPWVTQARCESASQWRYRGMEWLRTRFANSGVGSQTWNWWCIICFLFTRSTPSCPTDCLRDLRNLPFVGFQRWANPAFYDELMQVCARGGLSVPRIVQEATDRDTQLGLVLCRVGVAWQTESVRWHCPRGIVLRPVVDMNIRIPYNLIWKKDNSSPLLHRFVAQVEAEQMTARN